MAENVISKIGEYPFLIGLVDCIIVAWFLMAFLGIWQLYVLGGVIGGITAGKKVYKGALAGFLGTLIAVLLTLNFSLVSAMGALNAFIEIGLGMSGGGMLVNVIALLLWSVLGAVGGTLGASFHPWIPWEKIFPETPKGSESTEN